MSYLNMFFVYPKFRSTFVYKFLSNKKFLL